LDWSERLPADNTAWTPKVDIFETETNLVLKAELPGVDAKNVALSLEKDVLTLKGERRFENEDQKTIITVSSVPTAHSRGPSRYPRRSRRPKSMPTTKTASSR
jgi:HSP20 family molecular chaperone IbpA